MKRQDVIETIIDILANNQPCTVRALFDMQTKQNKLAFHIFKNAIPLLDAYGVVVACGKDGRATCYQLTGVSPYAHCETCCDETLRWLLRDGHCRCCRNGMTKGSNSQLDSEFQFLRSPSYQLLNQVLRP